MDFDMVLKNCGEYGKYQKLVLYLILLPCTFPCGFHAYNQIFMAATPEYWCENEFDNEDFNKTLSIELEECFIKLKYINSSNVSLEPCKSWRYSKEEYQHTVVTDFDLVCEKKFYPTLALVLFALSGLIGNYIFGYIQDGFGRKPAFFIYLAIQCFFGVVTSLTKNFTSWLFCRLGVGFTVPAILATPLVLAVELVGPTYRSHVTILANIAYTVALVSLSAIVWAVRDWRLLSLATTCPFFLLFLLWWAMPESPRWLLAKKKYDKAEKILNKMAKINGKLPVENLLLELKRKCEEEHSSSSMDNFGVLDLFIHPNLRLKTFIISFIWFTNTSVYVGLSYYAPAIGDDDFLTFFLAGAVEFPTFIVLWLTLNRFGRRWNLCFWMLVGGVACTATILFKEASTATLILYCFGKMGISSSFVIVPLLASEIYPTVIRGLGLSFSSVAGMLGPIFIPLVNYLGTEMMVLPMVIMGLMLLVGGVFTLLLPETLNKNLSQTISESEKIGLMCINCNDVVNNDEIK